VRSEGGCRSQESSALPRKNRPPTTELGAPPLCIKTLPKSTPSWPGQISVRWWPRVPCHVAALLRTPYTPISSSSRPPHHHTHSRTDRSLDRSINRERDRERAETHNISISISIFLHAKKNLNERRETQHNTTKRRQGRKKIYPSGICYAAATINRYPLPPEACSPYTSNVCTVPTIKNSAHTHTHNRDERANRKRRESSSTSLAPSQQQ